MCTADRLSPVAYGLVGLLLAGAVAYQRDGLTPDSCWYLDVAEQLANGRGLVTDIVFYDSQYAARTVQVPYTIQSPLYSLLVACLIRVGVPSITSAATVNVLCFGLSAVSIFELGMALRGRLVGHLATCGFLLTTCILSAVTMVWTESLFILLSSRAVLAACRAVEAECPSVRTWFECGTLAGMSFLARTTALFLIAGLCVVAVTSWVIRHRTRAARSCLLCWLLPAVAVPLLMIGRNLWIMGRLDGVALPPSQRSLAVAAASVATVVATDFFPIAYVAGALGVSSDGVALATVGLGVIVLIGASALRGWNRGPSFGIIMVYCGSYIAGITLSSTRLAFSLDSRTVCCIYPFLILAVVAVLATAAGKQPRWFFAPVALVLLVAFLSQQGRHTLQRLREHVADSHPAFDGIAPLREWILSHTAPREVLLATNGWWVHRFTGNRPILCATEPRWNGKVWDEATVLELAERYGASNLVIYFPAGRPELLDRYGHYLSEVFRNPASSDQLEMTFRGDNYACFRIVARTSSVASVP